jgi:hypothetical protein
MTPDRRDADPHRESRAGCRRVGCAQRVDTEQALSPVTGLVGRLNLAPPAPKMTESRQRLLPAGGRDRRRRPRRLASPTVVVGGARIAAPTVPALALPGALRGPGDHRHAPAAGPAATIQTAALSAGSRWLLMWPGRTILARVPVVFDSAGA